MIVKRKLRDYLIELISTYDLDDEITEEAFVILDSKKTEIPYHELSTRRMLFTLRESHKICYFEDLIKIKKLDLLIPS